MQPGDVFVLAMQAQGTFFSEFTRVFIAIDIKVFLGKCEVFLIMLSVFIILSCSSPCLRMHWAPHPLLQGSGPEVLYIT